MYLMTCYSFWTRYESGDISVQQGIIQFAMKKLTAGYSDQLAGGTSNEKKSLALLAALAVRLLLTFSVPAHREYL
jgi:hypothetical protein